MIVTFQRREKNLHEVTKHEFDISKSISLPYTSLTKRFAILAKVGAGKSYTGGVLAEEFLDFVLKYSNVDKGKLVIIDPQGIWYTLREKFPIHVLGGLHGDLDIDFDKPRKTAQMIHEMNLSVILDFKGERKELMQQFVSEFLDELYFLTRDPTMVFLEEGDLFAPQNTGGSPYAKASLDAVDSIVRRARGDGMGCTIISQRSQAVNKSVLEQSDVYIFHANGGGRALKVIEDLLKNINAKKETIKKYIGQITSFDRGEALIVSPSFLKEVKTVKIRERICTHGGETREFGYTPEKIELIPMKTRALSEFMLRESNIEKMSISKAKRTNEWVSEELPETRHEVKESYSNKDDKIPWPAYLVILSIFGLAVIAFL